MKNHQEFLKTICDNRFVKWQRLAIVLGALIVIGVSIAFTFGINQGNVNTEIKNLKNNNQDIQNKITNIENMTKNIDKNVNKILDKYNGDNTSIPITK